MLERGTAGTHEAGKGTVPVRSAGQLLATVQASNWREQALALVEDRSWTFGPGGPVVAESGATGDWSPRPTWTADPSLPLDHQVFLRWLTRLISRRMNATIAIAAGGAVAGAAGSS